MIDTNGVFSPVEMQVLSYCKEYMLHKDKNKYPFVYIMSY
jgi:hypothetical protein